MVKPGYKQTEIGVIPEDWDTTTLKDITEGNLTYGVNSPAVQYAPPLPNYLRITDISDDGYFIKENRTSVECHNSEQYKLKDNDIVFARTGASTGKTYLYRKSDGDLVYAGFLIKASISPIKANSKFVFNILHSKRYWNWVAVTSMRSGQPGINGNEYASFAMPCPPLPEQERIAEALSDVDELISSLEKLIEKYKSIKSACLQQMFPQKGEKVPRMRLPGFTDAWEQRKVREVADRYDNLRIPVAANLRIPGSTPYYGANGIQDYVDGYTHEGEFILVAEDGANDLKNYPVKCVKGRIWVNNHAHVLQGKNEIADNKFLAFAISQADIESLLVGGGRAKLNAETLMEIDLLLPVKQEQVSIGNYFTNLDNLITLHQRKLEKVKKIKEGMMQQLLTGKIRLL